MKALIVTKKHTTDSHARLPSPRGQMCVLLECFRIFGRKFSPNTENKHACVLSVSGFLHFGCDTNAVFHCVPGKNSNLPTQPTHTLLKSDLSRDHRGGGCGFMRSLRCVVAGSALQLCGASAETKTDVIIPRVAVHWLPRPPPLLYSYQLEGRSHQSARLCSALAKETML